MQVYGASQPRYSLLRFDTASSLPANVRAEDVERAVLRLLVFNLYTAGSMELHRITGTLWTGNTVEGVSNGVASGTSMNWNNSSAAATTLITPFDTTTTGAGTKEFISVDITSVVRGWITDPSSNKGLLIKAASGSAINVVFATKESDLGGLPASVQVSLQTKRTQPLGDVTMGPYQQQPQP